MHRIVAVVLATALATGVARASEDVPGPVRDAVDRLLQGVTADSIAPAVTPGLYEVVVGPHVIYVSADGGHMLRGDIIDLETRQNLTEERRRGARADAVARIAESDMIVFGPAGAKHTVTVFTDVECGYCRKLHSEMQRYNDAGIRVRYLAFPRAGVPSKVYETMVSVWCADDPRAAMTAAKAGARVARADCDNPVASEYELGRVLGISGTPTIIFEDGSVVPGYLPAAELRRRLEDAAEG